MKTKLTRLFSLLVAALLLGISSPAQLTVNTTQTPAQLAQLLTGTGVQILNPQIHGGANSYGKYNATSSNLNITEGVILTSGLATNAIGPNNTGSMSSYFGSPTVPTPYTLLTNYTGRPIYEYCELEFDIIPQGDTIKFPFVFGSEEYEEWVCSQYNDVFAFFISGPGIVPDVNAGIYKNIALLPNTNIPVMINSVNQNSYTQYYQNNNNGATVQYDGFTTGLTAVSAVLPCQVYHLKLIVADASDKLWDSGVFIEKISSNSVTLANATLGGTPFMIEGCNPGTVTFTRPNITNLPLNVTFWIGGSATNGTDYPLIGSSANVNVAKNITIPANQASATININPYADNIADNNEYITIYLGNPLCPSVLDSLRFYIHDHLNASVTPTSANVCVGTGTQLTASGDASAFVWTPNTGLNNANIPNPIATPSVTTTYNVSSSVGNCQSTLPVTINVSNISLAFTHTNINCSNSATGSATVTATGGFPPYIYAWTGPNGFSASTASISNLAAGTYTVVVTGQQTCLATGTVTITASPALSVSAGGNIYSCGYNVTCFGGNNGTATATVSGGTAPYTYLWNTTPAQTTATATGLPAGVQTVTVTDANGCTATATVLLTQPPALTATISASTNIVCSVNATGAATVIGGGGVPPYTYSWNTTPIQTGATATNLAAGTYVVTVRDANNCTSTASVTITQTGSLTASISAQTNVSCFGNTNGSATVAVNGGTAPFIYAWSSIPVQTSATASNLGAGAYVVTVTDANGCSGTANVTITQPAAALSASISAQTNVSCFGGNGSATVSVSGGTAPYTYSWNTTPAQASATATLAAGLHVVTVTDANGCSATASVTILQPSATLSASISAQTNVSCFGGNGSATVSVIGGTAPYAYSWNTTPVQTSATASGLLAGNYMVTITDANGCSATASVTISQPTAALSASISAQTNVSCFGNTNGSATVSVTGGTAPYTYAWSTLPVQTSATANNLAAGNYSVVVTDANGCSATVGVSIFAPASALTATISSSFNVSCFGGNNGSATVMVAGGTAPYTYSWNTSPIQTSATASNLVAGSYVATITDANGCSATASVVISQPATALFTQICSPVNVSCFGGNDGSVHAMIYGGTPPYTYVWSTVPVQTTVTATNLTAGTYTVTATDANGCTITQTFVITQPASGISATISAQTNVSCFGNTNGSATVSATGGTAPYTYSWNTTPVQTGATASNLGAGAYVVTITDANGCTGTASVIITAPVSALSASISAQTNVACFNGTHGSATVSVSGGTAPYSYSWNSLPVQTTATATNLAAGVYVVTITDANGCSATASVTISQPAAILSASISAQTNVACFNGTHGSATVSVTGGTAPYSYSWNTTPVQTSATASNLIAGAYVVTITDANGCSTSASVAISQPSSALSASISAQTNVSCFGNSNGSATVSVTGGTAPYSYSWNTTPAQSSATASNLVAGSYVVTITDANGCSATASVTITEPATALFTLPCTIVNVSCYGGNDGSLHAMVYGGTPPYTYVWSTVPVQTTVNATNLTAGTYTVTATDANGCTITQTFVVTQPASAISASISAQTNVSCFGNTDGSATVSATGGTAPYTYSWNTTPVQTGATASNLGAGVHVVTITDANGCTGTASVTITTPVSALSASISAQTNVACFNGTHGSATVSVSGGTAPYTYSWNTTPAQTSATASNLVAGVYVVTVTDANGCSATASVTISQPAAILSASITAQTNVACFNGTHGSATVSVSGGTAPYSYSWNTTPVQTSATASNLAAGVYVVTITDANGCSTTASVTISQPAAMLSASISSQINVACFNGTHGSATVSASGGTAPYTYSWNTTPVQTSATATNLSAGAYVVTITDANGCTATASVTITQPASAISASISAQTNVSCFGGNGGSATVIASGGTAPYTYSWNTTPVQTSAVASNLAAGSYIVTITDANGCSATASVTIAQPAAALSASISAQTNVNCFGNNNGSATVSVNGGTAPYSYSWNTTPVQTSATASGLVAGSYVVTITDTNGCTATASVTITQPAAAISASISAQTNVSCFNGNGGSATVTVNGGTAPYTYSWNTSPVQTSATASNLVAGSYVVTITDANGCSATASVTISQPAAAISASISAQTNVLCFGDTNGSATVSANGGTAPYSYSWNTSPVQVTTTASNLAAGSYVVTIVDANGCSATATATISQPAAALSATISAQTNVSCTGNNDGSATVSATGGTAPYTYSWNTQPAQLTATASNLTAGTYVCFVVDANNCSTSVTVTITQSNSSLSVSATPSSYNGSNISCFGAQDGYINITVSGGTAPYTYAWTGPSSFTSSSQNISGLVAGTYSLVLTDAQGCSITLTQQMIQPAAAIAIASSVTNSACSAGTGAIDLTVTGGTSAYTYAWSGPNSFTSSSQDVSGLSAGVYVVTVTDANGCSATSSINVTQMTPMLALIQESNFNGFNISCAGGNNGDLDLNVTGGNPAYTYSWTGPNGFTSSAQDITGLYAGTYSVTITDANGCTVQAQSTLSAPAPMTAIFTSIDANCTTPDGVIAMELAGGVAGYSYQWSNGATQIINSGLTAGSYIVTVTDGNGCQMIDTAYVGSASRLATAYTVTGPTCSGSSEGAIVLNVTNGTAPYTYAWSNGATTNTLSGLASGMYICTTTDSNGCAVVDTVHVSDGAMLSLTVSSQVYPSGHNISVMNGSDGSIDLTVEGGNAPYTYVWSNGATSEDLDGLSAGSYTVTVTDASGCSAMAVIKLSEPLDLVMPNGFSPNADGSNDYFVVQGLLNFPDNHVEIYNRWGNLVYSTDHYQNDWTGISNNGQQLPDATYFVILEVNGGEIKLNSYVDLRR